jgi:hypothetical protein
VPRTERLLLKVKRIPKKPRAPFSSLQQLARIDLAIRYSAIPYRLGLAGFFFELRDGLLLDFFAA